MIVELITLTEDLLQRCFELKVASDQTQYIASNSDSWIAAKENEKVARPFAIYCDGEMVGFAMFAFDEDYKDPDDRYQLPVTAARNDQAVIVNVLPDQVFVCSCRAIRILF